MNYNVTELCFLLALATILFRYNYAVSAQFFYIPGETLASCPTNSNCFQHWWGSYEKALIMFDSELKDNIFSGFSTSMRVCPLVCGHPATSINLKGKGTDKPS